MTLSRNWGLDESSCTRRDLNIFPSSSKPCCNAPKIKKTIMRVRQNLRRMLELRTESCVSLLHIMTSFNVIMTVWRVRNFGLYSRLCLFIKAGYESGKEAHFDSPLLVSLV